MIFSRGRGRGREKGKMNNKQGESTMKKMVFAIITAVCFIGCVSSQQNGNLVGFRDKNIKKIVLNYQDTEKYNELYNSLLEEYGQEEVDRLERQYDVYLFLHLRYEEYMETFADMEVSNEYWELIINELKKPKKKVGIFTPKSQPGPYQASIKIIYNNDKETNITLYLYNYYTINGERYYYGKGPNFGFIKEITK